MNRRFLAPALLVVFVILTTLTSPSQTTHGAGESLQQLPTDFVDEIVVNGLLAPRAFVWRPDGSMLIAERGSATSADINLGSIRIATPNPITGKYDLGARAITFGVCGDGERGFVGLALDPNFVSNGYVYTYYTRQMPPESSTACPGDYGPTAGKPDQWTRNRVSRWTMVGDTINPNTEKVLIDNIPSGGIHNSGDLQFDSQGNLYISVGDAFIQPSPAPDLPSLNGKILRIKPDASAPAGYTIPADNPYNATTGAHLCGTIPPETGNGPCLEIYASGMRNSFRIAVQPGTDQLFGFDVGGGSWEEINAITKGGNYGWPSREGFCAAGVGPTNCADSPNPAGLSSPIYSYYHDTFNGTTDAAVIGGAFYKGASFPAAYRDNLFFADFTRGWVRRLINNNGTWSAQDFGSGVPGIIGVRSGPDTNLYYVAFTDDNPLIGTSTIHRIRYESGVNHAPTAKIVADKTYGPLNLTITFSGAGSTDVEPGVLTCLWDFGGGDTTSAPCSQPQQRTYTTAGKRTITLRASDNGSPTDPTAKTSDPVSIDVFPGNTPPQGQIVLTNLTNGARGTNYYAGDRFSYSISNLSDDNTPTSAITSTWSIVFHHETHTHPFIPEADGRSGEFTIPSGGETSPVVWYRIHLYLTDAMGQTTEVIRDVKPVTTTIGLKSNPPGAMLQLDVETVTTPATKMRVVGIQSSLDAATPQKIGGTFFDFANWADGKARTHSFSIPAGGGTYTATFNKTTTFSLYMPISRR